MWNNQGGGYDGDGGFGNQGGGYMSPGGGGFGTPQGTQGGKSRSRIQNLLPVTIAEIFNATQNDDKFYTGDTEIVQVTFVGTVKSVAETPTRLDYEIEDFTGPPIEVKQFVDNDENVPDSERTKVLVENSYVRVFGSVRSFGGKRSVVGFKLTPLTDMNELTFHILETIHSHALLSRGVAMQTDSHTGNMMTTSSGDYNAGGSSISGLNNVQEQVHNIIRNNFTDQGANIESVCKQMRGIPEKSIRDAIEFLSSEGHIYSTIDDDHYKATDC